MQIINWTETKTLLKKNRGLNQIAQTKYITATLDRMSVLCYSKQAQVSHKVVWKGKIIKEFFICVHLIHIQDPSVRISVHLLIQATEFFS